MNITFDELLDKKTILQQIQEQLERQMRPLHQIQEMQNLVKRYSPDYQLKELTQQFEPYRKIQEMLERSSVPKHIQDVIEGSSIAARANRILEQYVPKDTFTSLGSYKDTIRSMTSLTVKNEMMRGVAGLDSIGSIAKQYEQHLKPISEHHDMLEKLRRQALGELSTVGLTRPLEEVNPLFHVLNEAKKSLDRLWPMFHDIDVSQLLADEKDEHDTKEVAESITQAVAEHDSLHKTVERIVLAIQAEQKPTVQLMLWLFFRKVIDWVIAGIIGTVISHYAPAVLGESPQAARKSVQEKARTAVGSPEFLVEYRYVSPESVNSCQKSPVSLLKSIV